MTEEAEELELENGMYMEICFAYNESILLPVDEGAEVLKLMVHAIPLKRDYDKPPEIFHAAKYPTFQLVTGASIKKERLEALLLLEE